MDARRLGTFLPGFFPGKGGVVLRGGPTAPLWPGERAGAAGGGVPLPLAERDVGVRG